MFKKIALVCLCLVVATAIVAQDKIVVDKIIGKVDNYYILKSDLETSLVQYAQQPHAPSRCQLLESLFINKLLLAKSEIDSVVVEDKAINNQLSARMEQMERMYGGPKNIVEQFGKSIEALKAELRQQVKEQLVAQKMQQKISEKITITPSEVRKAFNAIPRDSIPFFSTEVEVGQIVRFAKTTKAQKVELRQRLLDYRKRALAGEDFSKLATEYSEDLGSAKQGGDLYYAKRGQMVPEYEAAALKLKPGEMSDVVESEFGYHLIQMVDVRGQEYRSKHILLRPDYNRMDLTEPARYLDSLKIMIQLDSLTFQKAAKEYSQDKPSADTGGMLTDQGSGSSKIALDASMEPSLFFALDTMRVSGMSKPLEFRTEDGKTAMRIIYLKAKYPPHLANLKDDYAKLAAFALNQKKSRVTDEWFRKTLKELYFWTDEEVKACQIFGGVDGSQ